MMNEVIVTLLYKNITLSTLFLERVETGVKCVRDRQTKKDRDKGELRHCLFLLSHAVLKLDSGPDVFSSLTRPSQPVFTREPLKNSKPQDCRLAVNAAAPAGLCSASVPRD